MNKQQLQPKAPRGRTVKYPMPEPTPDPKNNVLKAVFSGPPMRGRRYLNESERKPR